jgi:DNA-binding response OmpR family regulator
MSAVLLIDASEELQAVAVALGRAGFKAEPASSEDAIKRIRGGESPLVVLVSLLESPGTRPPAGLLEATVAHSTAVLAIVSPEQLHGLDPDLPIEDFIVFPCQPDEAVARVRRALRRRAADEDENVFRSGDLAIDHSSYKVYLAGQPVELTYKEYELLRFLATNEGKVCTREMLLSRVWGYDFFGGARTVDVHIRRLRSKIEDRHHTVIETVRNVGYRFRAR